MNWDQIKGEWQTFKGTARENWGQETEPAKAEVNFWRSELV